MKTIIAALGLAVCAPGFTQPIQNAAEPVLTVHFDYYPKNFTQVRALERRLDGAMKRAGVGELGETELHADGNDGYLYLYGPDLDKLYAVAKPILAPSKLMVNAEVTKSYGAHTETFLIRR